VCIRPSQTAAFPTIAAKPEGGFKFIQPKRSCAELIHLVFLQSLGDTTFSKEPYRQTHRAYKWLQVPRFNLTINVGNDKF